MQTTEKYQAENCPRCGVAFICKPNNIGSCNCNKVIISKAEYEFISLKFSDCVCNNCLEELKTEFHLNEASTT